MLGEPMQNDFDALIDEINLVSSQKEQLIIAKAFENAQIIEKALVHKPDVSLNKALNDFEAMSQRSAKQAARINRANKRKKQVTIMKGFRTKLKGALMMKSITPHQAMTLENKFNNLTAKMGGLV